ncbi:hypothetical protein K3495_g17007, partial [Podosphaera aphanis]
SLHSNSDNRTNQSPKTPLIPPTTWQETTPSPLSLINTESDVGEDDPANITTTIQPQVDFTNDSLIPLPTDDTIALPDDASETSEYDNIMTGWDPIPPVAGHKRAHSPESDILTKRREVEITPEYDNIMTGWDPIPPVAGQKRAHSPDSDTVNKRHEIDITYSDCDTDSDILHTTNELEMTDYTSNPTLTRTKLPHSPEGDIMRTKRGRQ